jgi:hypothetical protein
MRVLTSLLTQIKKRPRGESYGVGQGPGSHRWWPGHRVAREPGAVAEGWPPDGACRTSPGCPGCSSCLTRGPRPVQVRSVSGHLDPGQRATHAQAGPAGGQRACTWPATCTTRPSSSARPAAQARLASDTAPSRGTPPGPPWVAWARRTCATGPPRIGAASKQRHAPAVARRYPPPTVSASPRPEGEAPTLIPGIRGWQARVSATAGRWVTGTPNGGTAGGAGAPGRATFSRRPGVACGARLQAQPERCVGRGPGARVLTARNPVWRGPAARWLR